MQISVASAEWTYAVACPPKPKEEYPCSCTITILSEYESASVQISTLNEAGNVMVYPGQPYKVELEEEWNTVEGVEDKGVLITADVEIQVILDKQDPSHGGHIDATQVYPLQSDDTEYYVASFLINGSLSYCSKDERKFYFPHL